MDVDFVFILVGLCSFTAHLNAQNLQCFTIRFSRSNISVHCEFIYRLVMINNQEPHIDIASKKILYLRFE